ncbi:MAG: DNA-binding protein WhiA [Lachnospirales bacterium]
MSFSRDVKEEVSKIKLNRHCALWELHGLLNNHCVIDINHGIHIKCETEKFFLANRIFYLIKSEFNCTIDIKISKKFRRNKYMYNIRVNDALKILLATKIINKKNKNYYLDFFYSDISMAKKCCQNANLRGEFIGCGSLSDPNKGYHLEFVKRDVKDLKNIIYITNIYNLNGKIVKRKDYYVLYIKESEKISDFLNIIGAHNLLLKLEDMKIYKDIRNNLNRKQNLEMANLNKTITAAVNYIDDINYIIKNKGLEYLPKDLQDLAELRLSETDITLKEIGDRMVPPISKSKVYYKFKKISKIAESIRSV